MYINYNNGGFWKDNIYKIKYTADYSQKHVPVYHTLFHQAAPFVYRSDGSGRDSYILFDSGLQRKYRPGNLFVFNDYLRHHEEPPQYLSPKGLSKSESVQYSKNRKIQKELTRRLFYSKKDNRQLPFISADEPLIKFYAKTGNNFYMNPNGRYSLTSPKYKENNQVNFRAKKYKVRVNDNDK